MTIMGDWAKGHFHPRQWVEARDRLSTDHGPGGAAALRVLDGQYSVFPKGRRIPPMRSRSSSRSRRSPPQEAFSADQRLSSRANRCQGRGPRRSTLLAVAPPLQTSNRSRKRLPAAILLPNARSRLPWYQPDPDRCCRRRDRLGIHIVDGDVTAMLNVIHQNYTYLSQTASQ